MSAKMRAAAIGDLRGKEIFEVQPVILGGSPTDPANKAVLTREQHIQAVRYWNGVIRQLRSKAAQSGELVHRSLTTKTSAN